MMNMPNTFGYLILLYEQGGQHRFDDYAKEFWLLVVDNRRFRMDKEALWTTLIWWRAA